MGDILRIYPKCCFPKLTPFEIKDHANGPVRGTWWYRDVAGIICGPFHTQSAAETARDEGHHTAPFTDNYGQWWWTDSTGSHHGPFRNMRDADADITATVNRG